MALRAELTEAMLRAEMLKEEPVNGDGAESPMNIKSCNARGWRIHFDPARDVYALHHLASDPACEHNLWHDADYREKRAQMARELLFSRWALEPLLMPRVSGA